MSDRQKPDKAPHPTEEDLLSEEGEEDDEDEDDEEEEGHQTKANAKAKALSTRGGNAKHPRTTGGGTGGGVVSKDLKEPVGNEDILKVCTNNTPSHPYRQQHTLATYQCDMKTLSHHLNPYC